MALNSKSELDKAMTPEQFTQIVEAILDGKYSWACVLILRFAGYNPLHYIPYRTYNRLMKENGNQHRSFFPGKAASPTQNAVEGKSTEGYLKQFRDLNHLDPASEYSSQLRGKGYSNSLYKENKEIEMLHLLFT